MKFRQIVEVLSNLDKTASRNLMTEILAEFLETVREEEVNKSVYLLLGQLGSMFDRADFGLADRTVIKLVARATDKPEAEILTAYKQQGDLGEVILSEGGDETNEEISVAEVFNRLMEIAKAGGRGSQERKIELAADLMRKVGSIERKYLVRMILGKMRLGFSDKTLLDALAVADKQAELGRKRLEEAYQILPDIGEIARLVKKYGCNRIGDYVRPKVGVPIMPALAQRLKSADEMIKKMGKVMAEPKFDGQRIQIHYKRMDPGLGSGMTSVLKTYARSLEENSSMFPELTQAMKQIKAESVILDCEAVGYDPATGAMKPFQEMITRKRKYGVEGVSKSVPVKFNCFDLLYLNGNSMLSLPLFERRNMLRTVIDTGEAIEVDAWIVTESVEELKLFHKKQLELGYEGAMVKQYDGVYQPGRTGWNWVKFKEVEEARGKLKDTIDGVVMGYYRGRGKRSVFGIGAFLLGILDEETQSYVTVAKIGTGLSDEQWREMRRKVDGSFSVDKPMGYRVAAGLVPDIWAEPEIVVEVAADEITRSPVHSSGFGLRFPRLVRFRQDKTVNQVTAVSELGQLKG